MVGAEQLAERVALVEESQDLRALREAITARSRRLVAEAPFIPDEKALLSRDGGVCPKDGGALRFDPWSPHEHRCAVCGTTHAGPRHHRHWVRHQHLWLAAQAAQLAVLGVLTDDGPAAERAASFLEAYGDYDQFPNVDNVLGPARLFFSTYLESIWITDYLAAAFLLRDAGRLDERLVAVVDRVADEAAALIGEFGEGFSNRQVWHNAALLAVACWFEDEDLAARAVEGDTGMLAHLAHGFGDDGAWHEGENYHLFALQGLLRGIRWGTLAGVDALGDPALAARLSLALHAPIRTALPDATFPARQDARFGVSLGQPMYLELWEVGLGLLQGREGADTAGIHAWLRDRYAAPAQPALDLDSWLYEAGEAAPSRRGRADLSWHVLLDGLPGLAEDAAVPPASILLSGSGLGILRHGARYVSLEGGPWASGHGHPDRLHLTLHDGGVHWLPDPGTGSYVSRDLFWYRSTRAHNAPMPDARDQQPGDATMTAWADAGDGDGYGWMAATWGDARRIVVTTPGHVLDIVEWAGGADRVLELPWHLAGTIHIQDAGSWEDVSSTEEFLSDVTRLKPPAGSVARVRAESGGASLHVVQAGHDALLRALAPGVPGAAPAQFLTSQASGVGVRIVSVLSTAPIDALELDGLAITVTQQGVATRHAEVSAGWQVRDAAGDHALGGRQAPAAEFAPLISRLRRTPERATALHLPEPPALDGTLDGFDDAELLHLDHEDQYRRSEEPYPGADQFGASAFANWDADALYLAVQVRKEDLRFRPRGAPALDLDNEPDDIHSDGLQVYLAGPDGATWGVLVVPEEGGALRITPTTGSVAQPGEARGAWRAEEGGYTVTLALAPSFWHEVSLARTVRFDLVVNEMRDGRQRRAGQLVWSGGGGWVWLRGDRQSPSAFGVLDLA